MQFNVIWVLFVIIYDYLGVSMFRFHIFIAVLSLLISSVCSAQTSSREEVIKEILEDPKYKEIFEDKLSRDFFRYSYALELKEHNFKEFFKKLDQQSGFLSFGFGKISDNQEIIDKDERLKTFLQKRSQNQNYFGGMYLPPRSFLLETKEEDYLYYDDYLGASPSSSGLNIASTEITTLKENQFSEPRQIYNHIMLPVVGQIVFKEEYFAVIQNGELVNSNRPHNVKNKIELSDHQFAVHGTKSQGDELLYFVESSGKDNHRVLSTQSLKIIELEKQPSIIERVNDLKDPPKFIFMGETKEGGLLGYDINSNMLQEFTYEGTLKQSEPLMSESEFRNFFIFKRDAEYIFLPIGLLGDAKTPILIDIGPYEELSVDKAFVILTRHLFKRVDYLEKMFLTYPDFSDGNLYLAQIDDNLEVVSRNKIPTQTAKVFDYVISATKDGMYLFTIEAENFEKGRFNFRSYFYSNNQWTQKEDWGAEVMVNNFDDFFDKLSTMVLKHEKGGVTLISIPKIISEKKKIKQQHFLWK